MQTERAQFLGGAVRVSDIARLKVGSLPRIVFAGRSNVGKSSLLNALTGVKVARVSAEPGKTREMNFYRWNQARIVSDRDSWILVDLPGYGYAKVSMELRKLWGQEIMSWLKQDELIQLVVALVDGRHGFMEMDLELVEMLKGLGLPYVVAFTKMDKWKSANQRIQAERKLQAFAVKLGVPRFVFVSATAKGGTRPLELLLREVRSS
jgi:GTP-binding protein